MLRWNPGYWDFVQVLVFFSFPAENATDFLHLLGAADGGAFSDICLAEGRPLKKARGNIIILEKSLWRHYVTVLPVSGKVSLAALCHSFAGLLLTRGGKIQTMRPI